MTVRGSIPEIIRNDSGRYQGNLIHYFRVVFYHAQNLELPYHNFRHMSHVLFLCHEACAFYVRELTPRQRRNLLIAALFHDFDHSGAAGNDAKNIAAAIGGLEKHLLPEDRPEWSGITALIQATEYPHKQPPQSLDLAARILRDADLAQNFSVAWIQQIVFGFAAEWGRTPIEVLGLHAEFLTRLQLHTEWGRQLFPQSAIEDKLAEARELLEILRLDS